MNKTIKDMKKNFKVGDRIMYKGYMYMITKVWGNYYDVSAIPPYDEDGVVTSIGEAGSDGMTKVPKNHQMTVGEFIYELQKFNPKAKVCVGDNFNNRVSIGWGYSEGCSKKNCEYVCLDVAETENNEKDC